MTAILWVTHPPYVAKTAANSGTPPTHTLPWDNPGVIYLVLAIPAHTDKLQIFPTILAVMESRPDLVDRAIYLARHLGWHRAILVYKANSIEDK